MGRRSVLIRLAGSLPVGSDARRVLLASLAGDAQYVRDYVVDLAESGLDVRRVGPVPVLTPETTKTVQRMLTQSQRRLDQLVVQQAATQRNIDAAYAKIEPYMPLPALIGNQFIRKDALAWHTAKVNFEARELEISQVRLLVEAAEFVLRR